jgi:PAS domain S-box-containing protein
MVALGWVAWRRRRGSETSDLLIVAGLWLLTRLCLLVVGLLRPGWPGAGWLAAALDLVGLILLAWPFLSPPLTVRWADRLAGVGLLAVALACGMSLWQWVQTTLGRPPSLPQVAITWVGSMLVLAGLAALNLLRHPARRRDWVLTAAGAFLAGVAGLLMPASMPPSWAAVLTAATAALSAAWLDWLERWQWEVMPKQEITPATPGDEAVSGPRDAPCLPETSTSLFAAPDLAQLLEATRAALTSILEVRLVALFLVEDNGPPDLRLVARWPQTNSPEAFSPFPLESSPVLAETLARGQTVNVTRELDESRLTSLNHILKTRLKAALVLPLLLSPSQGGLRGVLVLGHDGAALDAHQLQLCRVLAGQVAIAFHYIQLRTNAARQSRDLAHVIRRQEQDTGQLRAILESIADGVIISDANDQVILTNSAALDILGAERGDVIGNPFGQIIGCMAPAGGAGIIGTLTESSPYGMEAVFEVADRVVQTSMAPVEGPGGAHMGVVAILRDVTALVRTETERERLLADLQVRSQQLEDAARQLREMDRLKSQFIANMSHELRTPLNAIIGFSGVMLKGIDGPLTDPQREDLEAIFRGGKHLLGLINGVLDISQIWAGKMHLKLGDVDLPELVEDAVSITTTLIEDRPIELVQMLEPDLPVIRADKTRVRQVLLNLLTNAVKYTEQGRVAVSVSRDDGYVVVSVADTGIGIPLEYRETIFEEFGRVDASTTRKVDGLGLGLSISRRLVELHGGQIWLESEVGIGSVFHFSLPVDGHLSTFVEEEVTRQQLEAALAKW